MPSRFARDVRTRVNPSFGFGPEWQTVQASRLKWTSGMPVCLGWGAPRRPGTTVFSPVGVLAEMTAPAGEGLRRPVPGLGRLALVAADDGVAEVVPVAVGALQAGRRVDVGVGAPLGRVLRRDRVAGEAAVVGGLVVQVEEVAVLGVEIGRPVLTDGTTAHSWSSRLGPS